MTADAVESRRSTVDRVPGGQFALGNPGRKPGSKNKISNEVLQSLCDMRADAVQKLRELIMAGDFKAISYVLDKILPRDRSVELDDTSPAAIATALAEGHLTPDEARSVAATLNSLQGMTELADIRAKLDELEKLLNGVAR
ncbi:hypothetical protein [Mesorhizobium sp. B2-3-5]|uniref:hypothetical protein n=1 Tax=Mesorhizobium sp. B2-3-5 TaxID=2589958 RepID=UPI001129D8A3|nr:hypothetical protein [Mesorhizobium sp. B2-3-5]TPM21640.1 hypothetical protein FJ958_26025 [Mesorhizobium sp. B2-3-5]